MVEQEKTNTNRPNASARPKPWRKILYEKQNYPDNYVDSTFLVELKKNLHVRVFKYRTLVFESCSIIQQLCSVSILVTCYFYMEERLLSAQMLWLVASVLTVLGYTLNFLFLTPRPFSRSIGDEVKTCALFQGFSCILSPVLVSLTGTISTDTIYAMTVIMLLANLVFSNYDTSDDQTPGALSLNAAIFASVCLASRLESSWHAFATVTLAFELFAIWPVFRHNIKNKYPKAHVVVTSVAAISCVLFLLSSSLVGAVLLSVTVIFISFVCPAWLISLQPYKNNIYGPWDEAVVRGTSQ